PLAKDHRALDYLTGIPSQCTFMAPAKGLYETLAELEGKYGVSLSFTPGFPMADIPECGMAAFGYGAGEVRVRAATRALHGAIGDAERDLALELHEPDAAGPPAGSPRQSR